MDQPSIPIVTWLHLSDVHFKLGDTSQTFFLDELFEDITKQVASPDVPKPELILMTGDVAYSGQFDEYTQAQQWFTRLGAATRIARDKMFFIPGNHDVVKCSPGKYSDAFYRINYLRNGGDLDEVLSQPDGKQALMSRIAEYQKFASTFGPPGLRSDVGWGHVLKNVAGIDIKLAGLNTALLCNDNQDEGKLQLGLAQREFCKRSPDANGPEIVIAMTHHPLSWLRDQRPIWEKWLSRTAHVHLSGHIHMPSTTSVLRGTGDELVHVVAGAAHEEGGKADRLRSYNIAQLARQGERFLLTVWPRAWSESGYRLHVDSVPDGATFATHPLPLTWQPRPEPVSEPEEPRPETPPARVIEIPADDASRLELFPGSGLYSSLDLVHRQFVRLRIKTTSGLVEREAISQTGAKQVKTVETENEILIVRDPIRSIEIQIGLTRAMRPGGDPGSVPLVDGLTIESLRVMYPLILADPNFRWLRMVFAELASRPEVLKYIYEAELVNPEIQRIVARNPSTDDALKTKDCPFCNAEFLKLREIDVKNGARAINNDFPYGPYFHYIVMPKDPVHSWEKVTARHLEDMNVLVQELLLGYLKSHAGAMGVRIGLNSTIRHVVLGKSTRTSAGASVAHVHKQVWGMTSASVSASDYLQKICKESSSRGIDYLEVYLGVLRRCNCVIWEDSAAVLYVPLGQMSVHELQIMLKRKNSGSFTGLDPNEIKSLSLAEFYVTRLYQKMEINSFNELMYVKPFKKADEEDGFRLICTFITREIDLAVSELNSAYVVDKRPEDTIALVKKYFPDVLKETQGTNAAAAS